LPQGFELDQMKLDSAFLGDGAIQASVGLAQLKNLS